MAGGTWDMDSLTSIRGEARMYESIQKLGGGLNFFYLTCAYSSDGWFNHQLASCCTVKILEGSLHF